MPAETPSPRAMPPFSRQVKLAIWGLGLTQIIGYGTTYYLLGLLGGLIMADLGLSKPVLLAGVSLALLTSGLFAPAAGRWQDQAGSRLPMCIGSLLMGAGLLVIAAARDHVLYFLGWGIIALGSPIALYSACFTSMARMAGRNARRAIVLLTLLGGLASSIIWPITAWLMAYFDWRTITYGFGLLNILICAPLHALLLEGRLKQDQDGNGPEPVPAGLPPEAQRLAFMLLTGMLSLVSIVGNSWSMLAFPVLTGLGHEFSNAVFIASLIGVFQVLGRVGELALGMRFSVLRTAEVSKFCFALSFVLLILFSNSLVAGVLFALAYGIANGLNTIIKGTITLAIFGSRGYGERLGTVTLLPGLAAAIAPILAGAVLDATSAWGLVLVYLALSLAGLAATMLLTSHCRRHGLA